MDFLGTVLATAAGGLIGAGAAYGFARDLRRRDRRDEARRHAERYDEAMKSIWGALAAACRTDIHAMDQFDREGPSPQVHAALEDSRHTIERLLADAAGIARGTDATLVELLDSAHTAHLEPVPQRRSILRAVERQLMTLVTTPLADMDRRIREGAYGVIRRTVDDNY